MTEFEDTLNRIKKSVKGIVIVNHDGNVVRTTYT